MLTYAKANFAIAGVFISRLLPAVFLGPLAGVIADKLDRRKLMVSCDIVRAGLYISIPIFHNYFWLYTATILVECVTLFWSPAKEASVPNLVQAEALAREMAGIPVCERHCVATVEQGADAGTGRRVWRRDYLSPR